MRGRGASGESTGINKISMHEVLRLSATSVRLCCAPAIEAGIANQISSFGRDGRTTKQFIKWATAHAGTRSGLMSSSPIDNIVDYGSS